MNYKVAHLTSVHPRYDVRIFMKMCKSLSSHGYSVSLVVADGKGDMKQEGIDIYDVGTPGGRIDRMLNASRRVFEKAKFLDADIYHFHDPELIPTGLKLKSMGKVVVFDSHEDVSAQLLAKPYLNRYSRLVLSKIFSLYEAWTCKKFDAVIAATPFIRDKFQRKNCISVNINNFPILGELVSESNDWSRKRNEVCYVGGIEVIRGIKEIVNAIECVTSKISLKLCGCFSEKALEAEVKTYAGWQRVDALGWLGREEVRDVLSHSMAGLVTLHPTINYIDALPIKMFEYMSAGVPVIASNFPLWREIIEGNDCGLCVDPMNPVDIAEAIDYLVNNPDRAQKMGENGQRAVTARYNWTVEEKKLIDLYETFAR